MKILLVQPPKARGTIGGEDVFVYEPLALEYLASAVRSEHDVKILDLRLEDTFDSTLAGYDPDIVGITAYTVHANVVRALFRQVKAVKPETLTVVGGHHATVKPEDFLSPSIDLIVMGEGVLPFKEIVKKFAAGERLDGIAGTISSRGGTATRTECNSQVDLDLFPFPDRKATAHYRGEYYSEWMKPLASIRTSRGCPYRCNFCAEWKVAGGIYQRRKPERVVQELAEISEEYVFFADDESLIDAPRMSSLARLIKEEGIRKRYFLYGRSDTIGRHPELLELWRGIGLERVFIGLESFRDDDLAYIHKGSSTADNEKAVRILQALDIDIYASFIVRPDFSQSDFEALRRYCRRMKLNYATFAVLTPLPGTDLYEDVKEKMIMRNHDYCDFIHTLLPTTLPMKEFYAEYRRLYMTAIPMRRQTALLKKYPLREIPRIIQKGLRFYERLSTIHLDYAAESPVSSGGSQV